MGGALPTHVNQTLWHCSCVQWKVPGRSRRKWRGLQTTVHSRSDGHGDSTVPGRGRRRWMGPQSTAHSRGDGHGDSTVVHCQQSAFCTHIRISNNLPRPHLLAGGYDTSNEPRSVLACSMADLLQSCRSQSLGARLETLTLQRVWHAPSHRSPSSLIQLCHPLWTAASSWWK